MFPISNRQHCQPLDPAEYPPRGSPASWKSHEQYFKAQTGIMLHGALRVQIVWNRNHFHGFCVLHVKLILLDLFDQEAQVFPQGV